MKHMEKMNIFWTLKRSKTAVQIEMIFKGVGRLKERMLAIVLNKLDTNVSLKKVTNQLS